VLILVSRPIQDSSLGLPVTDAREHRSQSGRSGILASNRPGPWFSAAARAAEESFVGVPTQVGVGGA
jgi:hypothetical protein